MTIILLLSFTILAMYYLGGQTVTIVEDAMTEDIVENANFAWAHNFGHKAINDVNSYADFWSWCRLGFVPLIAPKAPWFYSESLQDVYPASTSGNSSGYDVNILPTRRPYEGFVRQVPVRNDYLRYNRIIGGFRFRQTVAETSAKTCLHPGEESKFIQWWGKLCTEKSSEELHPDFYATETFDGAERVEWFLMEVEDHEQLIQRVIDMEDGCFSARAQNRRCLCEWCAAQTPEHPWLNEQTKRVEISFTVFNAQYGIYCMATVNFWFNRAGHIHKRVNVRSSWAGLSVRSPGELAMIIISGFLWVLSCLYVFGTEFKEIISLCRSKSKPWHLTIIDDYLGFWNIIDWISIAIACLVLAYFVMLQITCAAVNDALGAMANDAAAGIARSHHAYEEQVQNFQKEVETMCDTERDFRFWLCIYPLVLMMRLFKSFAAQPRLAIVTNTFKEAKDDLLHFFLVFASAYFCLTVNSVLCFGQDSLSFSTLARAMHSCFRAMLGDWDWEGMEEIGRFKAFIWFFFFMMVMVLVLLNMLLAILMDSYSRVKTAAENADSLAKQCLTMIRRLKQNRRGERVKLNDIWDSLLEQPDMKGDDSLLLSSSKLLKPEDLLNIVPGIPKSQALRTLGNSRLAHDMETEEPFSPEDLEDVLARMLARMDNSVKSSAWLTAKLEQYQSIVKEDGLSVAPTSPGPTSPANILDEEEEGEEEEQNHDNGVSAVRQFVEERTTELAHGVASVLGEEMQGFERRQKQQQRCMEHTRASLDSLRQLVHKLNQTCEEVAELTVGLKKGEGLLEDYMDPPELVDPNITRDRLMTAISNGGPRKRDEPLQNHRYSAAVGGTKDEPQHARRVSKGSKGLP